MWLKLIGALFFILLPSALYASSSPSGLKTRGPVVDDAWRMVRVNQCEYDYRKAPGGGYQVRMKCVKREGVQFNPDFHAGYFAASQSITGIPTAQCLIRPISAKNFHLAECTLEF